MKFNIKRIFVLRPFDESEEKIVVLPNIYVRLLYLIVGVIAPIICACIVFLIAWTGSPDFLEAMALIVCVSAMTAGLEWHLGLRAMAANQLFQALLFASLLRVIV